MVCALRARGAAATSVAMGAPARACAFGLARARLCGAGQTRAMGEGLCSVEPRVPVQRLDDDQPRHLVVQDEVTQPQQLVRALLRLLAVSERPAEHKRDASLASIASVGDHVSEALGRRALAPLVEQDDEVAQLSSAGGG